MGSVFLYHHNSSVCAAKVRIALSEKNVPWDGEMMQLNGDQFEPDYLKLNPKAVVPTLVHNGSAITESNIILEYLDDAFPAPPLRPSDPVEVAMMRHWLMRLDSGSDGIHHDISVITYGAAFRHQLIKDCGGNDRKTLDEAVKNNMNKNSRTWLREVVFEGTNAAAFEQAVLRFDRLAEDVEQTLAGQEWLVGSRYSLADVAYTPYFTRVELLQFDALFANRPRLCSWFEQLKSRASYSEVIDRYLPKTIETLNVHGGEVADKVAEIVST